MIEMKNKIKIRLIFSLHVIFIVLHLTVESTKHASRKETPSFKLPETLKQQVKSSEKTFRQRNKLKNIELSSKKTAKKNDFQMERALLKKMVKEREALNERLWKQMIWFTGYGK